MMMLTFVDTNADGKVGTRPVPINGPTPVPRIGDHIKLVGSDGELAVMKIVWAYDVGIVYVHYAQ